MSYRLKQLYGQFYDVTAGFTYSCFEDPDVVHTMGGVDPVRDIEVITTELILADLEVQFAIS